MARNLAPNARALIFIDGQNAYNECRRKFSHGETHPLLLAEGLADGRKLVGVRYYSGVHDPTVNPSGRQRTDRRHNLMRSVGVTVVERQLRYRWEWGFDPKSLPDPRDNPAATEQVNVSPYQRPREKGIDLAIGLDVIALALSGYMDVAVVVSSDNDLCEAARATHSATVAGTRVSVEAAVFNERRASVLMSDYDYTHQLREPEFRAAQDTFRYHNAIPAPLQAMFVATSGRLRRNFPA